MVSPAFQTIMLDNPNPAFIAHLKKKLQSAQRCGNVRLSAYYQRLIRNLS